MSYNNGTIIQKKLSFFGWVMGLSLDQEESNHGKTLGDSQYEQRNLQQSHPFERLERVNERKREN